MNAYKNLILLLAMYVSHGVSEAQIKMPARGICAHRGASLSHPENTIAAFKEAIRLGAHMIELDLALTKDNKIVVLHDSTIDRTTNGSGDIKDWTLKDLKQLDAGSFKGPRFKGEQIPTFQEALSIMPENIWLNVHLKGGEALAILSTKEIVLQDRLHQCFLACGTNAASAAVNTDRRIKICNMERQANSLQYVRESIEAKSEFLQLFGGTTVNPMLTSLAKQSGLRINFCCTNDKQILEGLLDAGVEFPLVDDLQKMMEVAQLKSITPLKPMYKARNIPPEILTPTSFLAERVALDRGMATQGLASSEKHFFASNAGSIVRYSRQWKFIEEKKIRLPGVNHIGAIDCHHGFLWAGFLNGPENGEFDAANNKALVAKIDAATLEVVGTWDLTSKLNWIDPVCYDGTHLWVGDLSDLGIHRYMFKGEHLVHTGTLRYPAEMHFSQGIRIKDNRLFSIHTFGTMDGLFEFNIPKQLPTTPVSPVKVWRIPELFSHAEGFTFVPGTDDQIWHAQYRYVERIRLSE
ncbi:MAG: glycerophosphodiester phosphodiesterase [Pirellulaceae bacterium]